MSDPTASGSGGASFLSGLAGGFTGGYGFRQGIAERNRRARLQADLLLLRQQEAARQQAEEERKATTFGEQQNEYQRALGIRAGVAEYLRQPPRFATLGGFVSGKPPTRGAVPGQLQVPQAVGRALGSISDVPLSEEEQVLAGTDPEVGKAILERGRERARLRTALAGRARGASERPMTPDRAYAILADLYTVQDPADPTGKTWTPILSPRQRTALVEKMVKGTARPEDFPELPGPAVTAPAVPTPSRPWQAPGWLRAIIGGPAPGVESVTGAQPGPQPGMIPTTPQPAKQVTPTTVPDRQMRLQRARTIMQQYRELPPEDLEAALRESGYEDDEIREILGTPQR